LFKQHINTDEWLWRPANSGEMIHSNEVHVWRVFLDSTIPQLESLQNILSNDELERAGRFHFERDKNRFVSARGMLRKILGSYLGMDPYELRFEYTFYGKPTLAIKTGYDTLRFNLSHSEAFALYAVTRDRNIGIDLEHIRHDASVDQIAQRFFSKGEICSLEKMPTIERTDAFFQYWTRKEAFTKAIGMGVSFPMEQCDVSLMSGNVLSPITLPEDTKESSRWYGRDLFPGPGYVAAIAVEGKDWDLSCWDGAL
jgi:4'-phosphopantetheinyl transferase